MSVTKSEDGWDVTCPRPSGCAPFRSLRWPTKATAQARLDEHLAEHDEQKLMTPMPDFLVKHGLVVDADGKAVKA